MIDGKYFLVFDSEPIKLCFNIKDVLVHLKKSSPFAYVDVFDADGQIIKTYAANEFLERVGS